jgi:cation:H+ antiporter
MMRRASSRSVQSPLWQRHLAIASGCASFGVLVQLGSRFVPVPLAMIGLGIGLIGASFMLAWAADAGDAVFSGGLVLAVIALVAVLPEFIIETRFAYIQAADLVTANLTGATRLLLTGAIGLPLLIAFRASRGQAGTSFQLARARRLELGMLLITSVFAIQVVARGSLTVVDGVILLALYVVYARRVQGTPDEEPAVIGVPAGLLSLPREYQRPAITALILAAAIVVVLVANPFADALLETGTALGLDPYFLIQSVVPVATEAPEFVIVAVLVANRRPAQGVALFLASSVSQWTLGMGGLPLAYFAGGGETSMPLAGAGQLELGFTVALTLFAVAALSLLRPEKVDAALVVAVLAVHFIYPTSFVRITATFVLFVFAIDLFVDRRRAVPSLFQALSRRGGFTEDGR